MAKGGGGTRKSRPKETLSTEKINAVSDYMYTIDDNGAYSDSDKAKAIYKGREELKKLYPDQSFITVTHLSVDEQGYLHVEIGLNKKKIAGMPRSFGQIRYDKHDNMFHVSHEGYERRTATLNNLREQYKYIQGKQNFGRWDKRMEEMIDRHNNKPTKEHNAFMNIVQRYRLSK